MSMTLEKTSELHEKIDKETGIKTKVSYQLEFNDETDRINNILKLVPSMLGKTRSTKNISLLYRTY